MQSASGGGRAGACAGDDAGLAAGAGGAADEHDHRTSTAAARRITRHATIGLAVRIALGCMRIPEDGVATIEAALDAGITTFDTARAYAGSEELLGRVLGADPRGRSALVVTKCGMRRPGGGWEPDGRSRTILDDAAKSAAALGRPADVLLLHAPDPRVPLATSVRALVRAKEEGLAKAIGLSNVSRKQLEDAAGVARIEAVEVALGAYDDEAARGGVVAWCAAQSVPVFAHSPLGGPSRAPKLAGDPRLRAIAGRHGTQPAAVVIAYLLAVHPAVVPIVGARRPESAARLAEASRMVLGDDELALLDARFPRLGALRRPPVRVAPADAAREVVLLMGIAGAGKSRLAASYVARGYERLNRDTLGGTLKGIAQKLDERLARGAERIVLDNTYVTRASRADVVRIASMRGAAVRCVHVETPLHEAQVNVVVRMLEKHGDLLGPEAIRAHAKRDPNTLAPGALFRMARELEPPAEDEGFAAIERIPFAREAPATPRRPGMAIPFELVRREDLLAPVPREVPLLVFAWRPPAEASRVVADLAARTGRAIDLVACAHGDGPPVCWCRPPLPGAWLWFSHRRGVGREGSVLVATTAAHRTMAATLGLSVVDAR